MSEVRSLKSPQFTVNVTAELIAQSEKRSSGHCMAADAVGVARPKSRYRAVDLQTVRFTENGRRFTYLSPRKLQVGLVKFDQGIHVEPFSFQLRNGQSTPAGKKPAKERARLVRSKNASRQSIPEKHGGRTPPRLPNARRAFGLRGLEL